MKAFEVGEAIGQVFKITFANLIPFMVLGGACLVPYLGIALWQAEVVTPEDGLPMNPLVVIGVGVLGFFVFVVLLFIVNGAISYGVFQHLSGKKASLGDCIGVGFRELPRVAAVALVSGVLVGLGYLALIVPGIIAYVMFYLAVPVAAIERTGVGRALSRSRELTNGMRWRVFGVIFVLGMVNVIISLPLSLSHLFIPPRGAVTLQWVGTVFGSVLQAVGMGVVYYQLRSAREHFNVEEIASIFA